MHLGTKYFFVDIAKLVPRTEKYFLKAFKIQPTLIIQIFFNDMNIQDFFYISGLYIISQAVYIAIFISYCLEKHRIGTLLTGHSIIHLKLKCKRHVSISKNKSLQKQNFF